MSESADTNEMLVTLTADIVAAHVSNNSVAISDLAILINNVHTALSNLGEKPVEEEKPVPAVSIRASVKPDHIVCLEDGKKLKMLRRHLMTHYGMTPDAVSYTHLDVYKRQSHRGPRGLIPATGVCPDERAAFRQRPRPAFPHRAHL